MILLSNYKVRLDKMEDDFEHGDTETHMEDALKGEIPDAFESEKHEEETEDGIILAKGDGFVVGLQYDKIDLFAKIFVKIENEEKKESILKIANEGFETIEQDYHIYIS